MLQEKVNQILKWGSIYQPGSHIGAHFPQLNSVKPTDFKDVLMGIPK